MSDTVGHQPTRTLELREVTQRFHARGSADGQLVAVDRVSFDLASEPARIVSLVGQSGSGKSTIARQVLGLQRPSSGRLLYNGADIYRLSRSQTDDYRRNVQPVFQDPYAIFNPVYRVDRVLRKAVKKFGLASRHGSDRATADGLIETSLRAVELDPGKVLDRYPHQLSGGQRQRIMLARIHLLRPAFVIADEPVSMLDAQVRRHFLDILLDFRQSYAMTTLFITHDLSTVHYLGGDVMVITRGRLVEQGPVSQVMVEPSHPYTKLLLDSVPVADPDRRWTDRIEADDQEPATLPGAPEALSGG